MEVSPACTNCYARELAHRYRPREVLWGSNSNRRLFGDKHWKEPLRWNARAERLGVRPRVFCASMADVFDNHPACDAERERLWPLIRQTPALDWLLLTKRISAAERMLPGDWGEGYPNVWTGISVVTQKEVDRDVPRLLALPSAIRFRSCEPLIESIDKSGHQFGPDEPCAQCPKDIDCECGWKTRRVLGLPALDWVICGGESGPRARPMEAQWASDVADSCRGADVAFFMKQGSEANWPNFRHFEGFPDPLRIREFPKPRS